MKEDNIIVQMEFSREDDGYDTFSKMWNKYTEKGCAEVIQDSCIGLINEVKKK